MKMKKNKKALSDPLRIFLTIVIVVIVVFVAIMIITLGGCDKLVSKM